MTRLLVLSDLHSNAVALEATLAEVQRLSPDGVVVLGDLLTYGPAVNEILDTVLELSARVPTRFVLGNHDELYLDLAEGRREYADTLPRWLQEVVQWTAAALDVSRLRSIPFEREVSFEGVLLAHANPWGDWRYLNALDDHREAAAALEARGYRCGVFGHTHRAKRFDAREDQLRDGWDVCDVARDDADIRILNVGSVGQPRAADKRACVAVLDMTPAAVRFALRKVEYPVDHHLSELARLPLEDDVVRRLRRFFEGEPAAATAG